MTHKRESGPAGEELARGLRCLHLERDNSKPDVLSAISSPIATKQQSK
jgi:hypothetical protein